jgi:hypothetical protein
MSLWFTLQFGVSYHAIFVVPWLGWDLVEPITYSVTQGSAILGLFYMYRHRGVGVDLTKLDEFWQMRRQRKWLHKYGFDLLRLEFLREKLGRI